MAGHYFEHLNYSLGDEDSIVEMESLPRGTDHVVAVAGSGGRVVPLLARSPRRLTCVDISATQLALSELRLAALRALPREDYLGLLGYTVMPATRRQELVDSLSLSAEARSALQPLCRAMAAGEPLIYQGRFEKMMRTLSRVTRLFTGRRGRAFFEQGDLAQQLQYLGQRFPRRGWNMVVRLLGNATVLNSLLYRGEFPKKNLPGSTYGIYRGIFERLFRTVLARQSFFLQLVFFGELRYPDGFPVECWPDVYEAAQAGARKCEIVFLREDIVKVARQSGDVGYVSLSDVPSFLPPAIERDFLTAMKPGLLPGALVTTRGHLRVVTPDARGFTTVTEEFQGVIARETTQLWKVHIYQHTDRLSSSVPGGVPPCTPLS